MLYNDNLDARITMTTEATERRYESYVRYCNDHSLPIPSLEEYILMETEELNRQAALEDEAREANWNA